MNYQKKATQTRNRLTLKRRGKGQDYLHFQTRFWWIIFILTSLPLLVAKNN